MATKKQAAAPVAGGKSAPAAKKAAAKTTAPTAKSAKAADTAKTPAKAAAAAKGAAPPKASPTKAAPAKSAAKNTKNAAGLDAKFLEAQRQALLSERERYLTTADRLQADADALVEGREPGDVQFDEESGEGDTIAVERERDLAMSAQARQAVIDIDAALSRIEQNTYGICEASGLPIPKERLEAIPWARERVEYKAGGLGRR